MAIQVAICGPNRSTDTEIRHAHEVGELLAQRGAIVLCGGYGGVMEAAAAGARAAGGVVVGILSGDEASDANPHLSITIPTGLGQARNAVLVGSADAVIAVGGSWGTLSEVAHAMRRGTVPVLSLGGWRIVDAEGTQVPGILHVDSPAAAVDAALE